MLPAEDITVLSAKLAKGLNCEIFVPVALARLSYLRADCQRAIYRMCVQVAMFGGGQRIVSKELHDLRATERNNATQAQNNYLNALIARFIDTIPPGVNRQNLVADVQHVVGPARNAIAGQAPDVDDQTRGGIVSSVNDLVAYAICTGDLLDNGQKPVWANTANAEFLRAMEQNIFTVRNIAILGSYIFL